MSRWQDASEFAPGDSYMIASVQSSIGAKFQVVDFG
jgi:hypothetical protein